MCNSPRAGDWTAFCLARCWCDELRAVSEAAVLHEILDNWREGFMIGDLESQEAFAMVLRSNGIS